MRPGRGLMTAGIVVLVLGILFLALFTYVQAVQPPVTKVDSGAEQFGLSGFIGPLPSTITWSNATATSTIYLSSQQPNLFTCAGTVSNYIAKGTGANGSFSVTLAGGSTYYIFACDHDALHSFSFSFATWGISILTIIGIVVIVVGIVLLLLGRRGARKAAATPATPSPPPPPAT